MEVERDFINMTTDKEASAIEEMLPEMLSPCGINCTVCYAHLREKNICPGCRSTSILKPGHCLTCSIKVCGEEKGVQFCIDCSDFPCKQMKRIDMRYRLKYHTSLIANQSFIREESTEAFLVAERKRWTCPACGGRICIHTAVCSNCGKGQTS